MARHPGRRRRRSGLEPGGLLVNGHPVAASRPLGQDSAGRPLPHAPFGSRRLAPGEVWLFAPYHPRSYDSRYFGPVALAAVRAWLLPLAIANDDRFAGFAILRLHPSVLAASGAAVTGGAVRRFHPPSPPAASGAADTGCGEPRATAGGGQRRPTTALPPAGAGPLAPAARRAKGAAPPRYRVCRSLRIVPSFRSLARMRSNRARRTIRTVGSHRSLRHAWGRHGNRSFRTLRSFRSLARMRSNRTLRTMRTLRSDSSLTPASDNPPPTELAERSQPRHPAANPQPGGDTVR